MAQLLSNLPIRSLVKFGKHQVNTETAQPIIWMVADKNHSGYPANSVSLITQKIIDLRAHDALEIDDEVVRMASVQYEWSNIHQWLNSEASAGNWYTQAHNGDYYPSGYSVVYNTGYYERAGFLHNFSAEERLALLPTTLVTQTYLDVSKSVVAKVFIPSLWETLGTHNYADGSSRLACFASGDVRCGLTYQAFTNTLSTSKPTDVSAYWHYMTRSTVNNKSISGVTAEGLASNRSPWDGSLGVRPIINLSANLKVTDTPDSDGCYTVLYNNAPVISGTNGDLGSKSQGFTHTYTVNDADKESVTVKEYIDNRLIRSYVATLNATNSVVITGETWLELVNGIHTIKIVATDGFAEVTRTHTFTKSVTKLVVQRAVPIESATKPKSIRVTVVKNIPAEALFKVEVCNNGYDTSPTWEDITDWVISGRIYDFENTTKTASKWGVNVKVTVDRNGAEGACYITEIGGNWE
jgi:hypothetical protein